MVVNISILGVFKGVGKSVSSFILPHLFSLPNMILYGLFYIKKEFC